MILAIFLSFCILLGGCSGIEFIGRIDLPDKQISYWRPYTGVPGIRLHEAMDRIVYDKATGNTTFYPGGSVSFKGSGSPLGSATAVGLPPIGTLAR